MSFTNCKTCGKRIGHGTDEIIYCDGGLLALNHGGGQCKECYSKGHDFCKKCNIALSRRWNFCPICGEKIIREEYISKV